MVTSTTPASHASTGLAGRALGVVFSPRATYADVAARPRAAGMMATILLVVAAASFVFFSTTVGQEALIDQQIRTIESFGRRISDAQYARLEQVAAYGGYITAASQVVAIPCLSLVAGAVLLAVFNLAGGDATFKQVFAVVVHSQVLLALQRLFVLPLDYAKESVSSPTNLGVFLPFLDETSFAAHVLGSIDLFWLWILVNLSIGLGVLYRRRTMPIATTLLIVYAAAALVVAAVRTALSGA